MVSTSTGLYIIDDDGERRFAGPFDSETAAITWIAQRQDALSPARQQFVDRQTALIIPL